MEPISKFPTFGSAAHVSQATILARVDPLEDASALGAVEELVIVLGTRPSASERSLMRMASRGGDDSMTSKSRYWREVRPAARTARSVVA